MNPKLTANLYTKLQLDDARRAVAKIDVVGAADGSAAARALGT